jgi:predicted ATP-dependent protease
VIEESARLAGDSRRLSTQMRKVVDLVREADFWARKSGRDVTGTTDVCRAIDARVRRASRLRDRLQDEILRDSILVETEAKTTFRKDRSIEKSATD